MSRYIGKRVSYTCGFCNKLFTLNKKSVDDSQKTNEVFCSITCFENFYLSDISVSIQSNDELKGAWEIINSIIRNPGRVNKNDLKKMANNISHVITIRNSKI
jgi:hypothetical protein